MHSDQQDQLISRETIAIFSQVAQKLAEMKTHLGILHDKFPSEYTAIREKMNDCQEIMATYCDCAPIRLIAGQVDEIFENLNWTNDNINR